MTKNLVTFKGWDWVKEMKNFYVIGVHRKIWFLGGGRFTKNQSIGGIVSGGLGQFADLEGEGIWVKKRGWFDTPIHTMGKQFRVYFNLVLRAVPARSALFEK